MKWKSIISILLTAIFVSSCNLEAEQTAIPEPIVGPVIPEGNIDIVELDSTIETVRNCGGGNSAITKHPSMTALTGHAVEWVFSGEAGVGFTIGGGVIPGGVDLSGSLQGSVALANSVGVAQAIAWDLPAEPNSIMEYTLEWREVWQNGYVNVRTTPESKPERIDVRYRTSIQSDIIGQRELSCDEQSASPTQAIIIQPTPKSTQQSQQAYTIDDINRIIGVGNWRCIDGFPSGISIDNLPQNFVVALPFTRIDKQSEFYYAGATVTGGGYATGWLLSNLPENNCSLTQPEITKLAIDQLVGTGNWQCLEQYPTGVKVSNVPSGFTVQSPAIFVDKDMKRYYKGDAVPSGGPATVWFPNEVPFSECP